jgi:hypothetical protein
VRDWMLPDGMDRGEYANGIDILSGLFADNSQRYRGGSYIAYEVAPGMYFLGTRFGCPYSTLVYYLQDESRSIESARKPTWMASSVQMRWFRPANVLIWQLIIGGEQELVRRSSINWESTATMTTSGRTSLYGFMSRGGFCCWTYCWQFIFEVVPGTRCR